MGSGRRISPQFLSLVPVFDSLVVSLRDPRGSGVGTETIFTLVYTSTDISTTVTAISNFRRSIQKVESSPNLSSIHQSLYPSIHQLSKDTNNQPNNTSHQSQCLPRPLSPRSSSPLRRSPSRLSTMPSHLTRRVGTTGTVLSGPSALFSAPSVCLATFTTIFSNY